MLKQINAARLALLNAPRNERGEISIEYVLIAAGLLVLVYGAFTYLGGEVSNYVRSLPALLGFG